MIEGKKMIDNFPNFKMCQKVYCYNCKHWKKAPKIYLSYKDIPKEFRFIEENYGCYLEGIWYIGKLNRFHECVYYEEKRDTLTSWWKNKCKKYFDDCLKHFDNQCISGNGIKTKEK